MFSQFLSNYSNTYQGRRVCCKKHSMSQGALVHLKSKVRFILHICVMNNHMKKNTVGLHMYLFCFKCFITHVLSKSPLRGKCRNIIDLFFNSMYIKDQWLHKICNFAIFVTFDENHFHTFSQNFTMCSFILVGAEITSLLTDFYLNSLHWHWYSYSLYCSLHISSSVDKENNFYNHELLKLAIISIILVTITCTFESRVIILCGEVRCHSLLENKKG